MPDSRKPDAARDNFEEPGNQRNSEATTDKTLSDVERTEEDSRSTTTQSDSGPSPDGALDETDESKDAGPM